MYSILLTIATNVELQKATHGPKLELLEATLVTLESYKRCSEQCHAPKRFRVWGGAPNKILKCGWCGSAKFLVCAFFLLLLKGPDTQMACDAPKNWPHFGLINNFFRHDSSLLSLLCSQTSWYSVPRYRRDQGAKDGFKYVDSTA